MIAGRTAGADIELRFAIDRDGLHRTDGGNHEIANVAQRLAHVRPFVGRRHLEGLLSAVLPGCGRAQQLPGRKDARDACRKEIDVELFDLRRAPWRSKVPGAVAWLVLSRAD